MTRRKYRIVINDGSDPFQSFKSNDVIDIYVKFRKNIRV